MSSFDQLINGAAIPKSTPPPTQGGAQQGTIFSVGESTAKVVLDNFSQSLYFEMPFGRSPTPPQAGDKCLVIFLPGSTDAGWIVAWNVDS